MVKKIKGFINDQCVCEAEITLNNGMYEVQIDGGDDDCNKFNKLKGALEYAKEEVFELTNNMVWLSLSSDFNSWESEENKQKHFNQLNIKFTEE